MRQPAGRRATAYVRVCAWKSRLLGRLEATTLMLAADAAAMQRAVTTLGLEAPLERLVRVYRMTLRGYPDAAPVLLALLRLHEIENVKLLWRVVMLGRDRRAARRLWIPLGPLATVPIEALDSSSGRDLVERLARTPFASIVAGLARAYGNDTGAAELAFDRWASQQLLAAVAALHPAEKVARQLIESVVHERDCEILRRGERWFGLSESAARAAAAEPAEAAGPLSEVSALRAQRLRLCRRAFVGDPFAAAPAIALVLLAEEELRGARALIERRGEAALDAAAARAMAGALFAS